MSNEISIPCPHCKHVDLEVALYPDTFTILYPLDHPCFDDPDFDFDMENLIDENRED